uniref:Uncharacterized protein n=1 Tax=Manihot esculenta TaxID=3983 RepID=A0A2C9VZX7_MANES
MSHTPHFVFTNTCGPNSGHKLKRLFTLSQSSLSLLELLSCSVPVEAISNGQFTTGKMGKKNSPVFHSLEGNKH